MTFNILPSLLSANILNLGQEVDDVIKAGADMLHLDVMDNHYVPNLTYGPAVCDALRKHAPTIPIDVHLMVKPVDDLILQFAIAGASRISIHPDATIHLDRSLQLIHENHCQAGLVLNPATSLDSLTWCVHRLDFILIMTVNPGFGGQMLIPEVLPKITELRARYPKLPICIDGGVTTDNIAQLAKAGATEFVAGSAIFKSNHYHRTIQKMKHEISRS